VTEQFDPSTPSKEGSRAPLSPQQLVETLLVRNAQLEGALRSRVVIEQAKGVLAERFRLPLDEAFALLRQAARSQRIRIHALAAAVVSSETSPPQIERLYQNTFANRFEQGVAQASQRAADPVLVPERRGGRRRASA
jgi:hypothetical protein